jgi:anti-sigma28 factor (negative regulator of flagellin synthesis)
MRRNSVNEKSSTKNTAKKVNKKKGLTVSQSQQLDNTFERASTLDEKRLAAVR